MSLFKLTRSQEHITKYNLNIIYLLLPRCQVENLYIEVSLPKLSGLT